MAEWIERLAPPIPSFHDFSHIALKWTPRLIIMGIAGYYSLGIAYNKGLMATIDRVAISILRHHVGYIGLGAAMPTFQWYSAWTVRTLAAIAAGILYDLIERIARNVITRLREEPEKNDRNIPLNQAPLQRYPKELDLDARELYEAPIKRLSLFPAKQRNPFYLGFQKA